MLGAEGGFKKFQIRDQQVQVQVQNLLASSSRLITENLNLSLSYLHLYHNSMAKEKKKEQKTRHKDGQQDSQTPYKANYLKLKKIVRKGNHVYVKTIKNNKTSLTHCRNNYINIRKIIEWPNTQILPS